MPSPSLPTDPKGALVIRRRHLLFIAAAVVAAAVLIGNAPVDAATRKVALGVSDYNARNDIGAVDAFISTYGKPATWTLWSTWGNPDTKWFPTTMVKKLKARGIKPLIFWEPMKKLGLCTDHARARKVAAGKFDGYIKKWMRQAKRANVKTFVRPWQEINGSWFPWGIGNCGNTAKHFKAAWKRVYNLTRHKVGAKKVKFVWSIVRKQKPCPTCNYLKKVYPGNRYVQFAAYSIFNWGGWDGKPWQEMADRNKGLYKLIGEFTKKPIMVVELGSNEGPSSGMKADWIRDGYPETRTRFPRVKLISWFNVNLAPQHPNWRVDSSGSAANAYKQVMANPLFQGSM